MYSKRHKRVLAVFILAVLILTPIGQVYAAYPILRVGSRGSEVSKLQTELKVRGYFKYPSITGYYGYITQDAVIRFQRDNRLGVDGLAGPQTLGALYRTTTTDRGSSTGRISDEVFWLARVIHAEASGEPYNGKVAVGNVVLNRVRSNQFPNTIYNVIFEYYMGIPQFSPVADGSIYNTPSSECIRAAQDALNGSRPVGDATYFFNPSKAAGSWIVNNKQYVGKIGGHAFYR
ncbi:MAG: cell wall hydrolase [Clostridiales bacterium]|nr:cell wall hydrolase [Clostridiales bacterium]